MNTTPTFSARTNQRWYAFYILMIALVLAIASALFMWFWLLIPGPAILVGGTFSLCGIMVFLLPFVNPRRIFSFMAARFRFFSPPAKQ